jgi:hypothetical protein
VLYVRVDKADPVSLNIKNLMRIVQTRDSG